MPWPKRFCWGKRVKQTPLSPELYDYLLKVSLREDPILGELREDTASHDLQIMQIPPEQGQFMQFLLRLMQATLVLELGTFTGYSALAMALALPDEGRIITCDKNLNWTAKTIYYWEKAKQAHKIQLRIGPALDTLADLMAEGYAQRFDFIFIDADKANYRPYYEYALSLIRPGGLIAIDNVLWNGEVINEDIKGAQVREIRRLNAFIQQDPRVNISLLPIADGLFLIQPKPQTQAKQSIFAAE